MKHFDLMPEQMEKNKNSYNEIANEWNEYRRKTNVEKVVIEFASKIKSRGDILDIGCGTGFPIAKYLSDQGFFVTGIDISENQIQIANDGNINNAQFYVCDFFDFMPDKKYDGIIAFDSFFYFPREKQKEIYGKVSGWMKAGAYLLFTHGKTEGETEGEMFGKNFYYSSLEALDVKKLLLENNLHVELSMEDYKEENVDRDLIILAQKTRGE
ncbi:MAG: class I SAM-dependent methyltransferase [Spirochaetaceae bacterium]|jgi:predicted TPR repeat methyltransferase|nr:class I SAM-dependent methyltransferase [Spirochaetaceae bacterium]